MNRTLKELYGSGILFFYFLKWPYFIGFPLLYDYGLNNNIILSILWFFCAFLIAKDLYTRYKDEQAKKANLEDTKE